MATAKKTGGDFEVVLTLNPVEARFITLVIGKSSGWLATHGEEAYQALNKVVGPMPYAYSYNFNTDELSNTLKEWVENGE